MKNKKIDKLFVQCDCGSEYIVLEPQDIDCLECGLYMGVLANAYHKPSFWHRFRHIWYTLKHGKPYTDQVCLDLDKVKKLEMYLKSYIAMAELDKKYRNKKDNKSNMILIYPTKKGK